MRISIPETEDGVAGGQGRAPIEIRDDAVGCGVMLFYLGFLVLIGFLVVQASHTGGAR